MFLYNIYLKQKFSHIFNYPSEEAYCKICESFCFKYILYRNITGFIFLILLLIFLTLLQQATVFLSFINFYLYLHRLLLKTVVNFHPQVT